MTGNGGSESPGSHFDGWNTRVSELRGLYLQIQDIATDAESLLGSPATSSSRLGRLASTGSVLERETFRVMVLGEFSSGKSTLINALLGRKLLPTKANPATAFTTLLRWGEHERAELYRNADRTGGVTVTTIEEFQHEVSLQLDADGASREPSFALAVVSQPLDLLRRSVELVDSAGLNESPTREQVTLQFLEQVDAVLFVTDASRAFNMTETDSYLAHVRRLGHRQIFYVVNQFDRIDEDEQAEVMARCRHSVARFGDSGGPLGDNVFFVSAKNALKARLAQNEAGVRASGIVELEKALETFCMLDAARVKFVRIGEFLRENAIGLRQHLQEQSGILLRSTAGLRESLEQSQAVRDALRRSIREIREVIDRWIEDMEDQIRSRVALFLQELAAEVPGWPIATNPSRSTVGRLFPVTRSGREEYARKLGDSYTITLQRRLQLFAKGTLEGELTKRQEELGRQLTPLLQHHEAAFADLRTDLSGVRIEPAPDFLLRTLALSIGWGESGRTRAEDIPLPYRPGPMLGVGTGAGIFGVAGLAGLLSLGVAIPPLGVVLGIGAAVGPLVALGAAWLSEDKLRAKATEQFAAALLASAPHTAKAYAESRATNLREVWHGIANTLESSLEELVDGVQRTIDASRLDEQQKQHLRDALYAHEQRLTTIEKSIGDFLRPYVADRLAAGGGA
ncbi:hypothetical protein C7C46_21480 [Streptomyces tateyamensis]|uniref:Dynamin N-terminal domain-containing protein n=2 Tax=Streptomyces tateyamensis TaxID=565073 RepID=A0A2V4MZA2_9ACTN|nr:hypothetical protein C7C46_21480 [Streptomyces tateyamensis]